LVTHHEIRWEVLKPAGGLFSHIYKQCKPEAYDAGKVALKQLLCAYFNSESGTDCAKKGGSAVAPVGFRTGKGGKCLKVRWLVPGHGKSGGMRIAVVVYCDAKHVKLANAWLRKDDPSDAEFAESVESA
jgi:hypothetical protein